MGYTLSQLEAMDDDALRSITTEAPPSKGFTLSQLDAMSDDDLRSLTQPAQGPSKPKGPGLLTGIANFNKENVHTLFSPENQSRLNAADQKFLEMSKLHPSIEPTLKAAWQATKDFVGNPLESAKYGLDETRKFFTEEESILAPHRNREIDTQADLGTQIGRYAENLPRSTRAFNRWLDPQRDTTAPDWVKTNPLMMPFRAAGRGVAAGVFDPFFAVTDLAKGTYEEALTRGSTAQQEEQMLDPYGPNRITGEVEPYDPLARDLAFMPARIGLRTGSIAKDALATAFGAADPQYQDAQAEGRTDVKPSPARSIGEVLKGSFSRAQAHQRGEVPSPGAENMDAAMKSYIPVLIEDLQRKGLSNEEVLPHVKRQLMVAGWGADAAELLGELIAAHAVSVVTGAAKFRAKNIFAKRAADRAAKVEALAPKTSKVAEAVPEEQLELFSGMDDLKKAAPETVKGPIGEGSLSTTEFERLTGTGNKIQEGAKKAVEAGKAEPEIAKQTGEQIKKVSDKIKESVKKTSKKAPKKKPINSVLRSRANNLEKRGSALAGENEQLIFNQGLEIARKYISEGNDAAAENALKTVKKFVEQMESRIPKTKVDVKPFAKPTPKVETPAVENIPKPTVSTPPTKGGPLNTGILRSKLKNVKKKLGVESADDVAAAEAMINESLPKADKMISDLAKKAEGVQAPAAPKPKGKGGRPRKKRPDEYKVEFVDDAAKPKPTKKKGGKKKAEPGSPQGPGWVDKTPPKKKAPKEKAKKKTKAEEEFDFEGLSGQGGFAGGKKGSKPGKGKKPTPTTITDQMLGLFDPKNRRPLARTEATVAKEARVVKEIIRRVNESGMKPSEYMKSKGLSSAQINHLLKRIKAADDAGDFSGVKTIEEMMGVGKGAGVTDDMLGLTAPSPVRVPPDAIRKDPIKLVEWRLKDIQETFSVVRASGSTGGRTSMSEAAKLIQKGKKSIQYIKEDMVEAKEILSTIKVSGQSPREYFKANMSKLMQNKSKADINRLYRLVQNDGDMPMKDWNEITRSFGRAEGYLKKAEQARGAPARVPARVKLADQKTAKQLAAEKKGAIASMKKLRKERAKIKADYRAEVARIEKEMVKTPTKMERELAKTKERYRKLLANKGKNPQFFGESTTGRLKTSPATIRVSAPQKAKAFIKRSVERLARIEDKLNYLNGEVKAVGNKVKLGKHTILNTKSPAQAVEMLPEVRKSVAGMSKKYLAEQAALKPAVRKAERVRRIPFQNRKKTNLIQKGALSNTAGNLRPGTVKQSKQLFKPENISVEPMKTKGRYGIFLNSASGKQKLLGYARSEAEGLKRGRRILKSISGEGAFPKVRVTKKGGKYEVRMETQGGQSKVVQTSTSKAKAIEMGKKVRKALHKRKLKKSKTRRRQKLSAKDKERMIAKRQETYDKYLKESKDAFEKGQVTRPGYNKPLDELRGRIARMEKPLMRGRPTKTGGIKNPKTIFHGNRVYKRYPSEEAAKEALTKLRSGQAKGLRQLRKDARDIQGRLQGEVKKAEKSKRINKLIRDQKSALSRKDMKAYHNATEDLRKMIESPEGRDLYLKESAMTYEKGLREAPFNELYKNIADIDTILDDNATAIGRIFGDKRGALRVRGGKPDARLTAIDQKARIVALRNSILNKYKDVMDKSLAVDKSLKKYLIENAGYAPKDASLIVKEYNKAARGIDKATKIQGINVDRLTRDGVIKPSEADRVSKIAQLNEAHFTPEKIGKLDRTKYFNDPAVRDMVEQLGLMSEGQLAAIPDVAFAQFHAKLTQDIANGISVTDSLINTRPLMEQWSKFTSTGGRWLQLNKNFNTSDDLIKALKKVVRESDDVNEIAQAKAFLDSVKHLTPSKKMLAWKAYHEFAVNNVLSAGITQVRNIFGITAEVMFRQPADRVGRALWTSMLGGKVKNPAYWSEVIPEIAAIWGNAGRGGKMGYKMFKYGSSQKYIAALRDQRIAAESTLAKMAKSAPGYVKQEAKVAKLRRSLRDILEINVNARTGEVFTGQSSTLESLAKAIQNPNLSEASGVVARVYNTPVRALVGFDAAATFMSFQGNKAARLIRNAIKEGHTLGTLRKAAAKMAAEGKFTPLERNLALQDSMYYLYRRDWGKIAKFYNVDKQLHKPVIDNLFLFMKTRVNILKNYIDNSPFGFVNVINESVKAKGLDARSFARWTNGTAMHIGLYNLAKSKGWEVVGPSENKKERDGRRLRGEPELYIKDANGVILNASNLAPFTPLIATVAAAQQAEKRGQLGQTLPENARRAFDQLFKSTVEEAMFADVKGIQRTMEKWGARSEDPSSYGSQEVYKDLSKLIAGRTVPNILRETKQSGKVLGVGPFFKPDKTIVEPSGNFLEVLGQTLLGDIPGLGKDVPKRVSPFTGKEIQRSERFSPFNPQFYSVGSKPGSSATDAEIRVSEEMARVKAGFSGPRGTARKGYLPIKLNNKEKRIFIDSLSGKHKEKINLLNKLDRVMQSSSYKRLKNYPDRQRKLLERVISRYSAYGYRKAVQAAVDRLWATENGRKRMWYDVYKGSKPYTGDLKELKTLLRSQGIVPPR